ncbi:uncharacterized protein TNCV_562581 [Trichonephila clavipes]|nr:uncharacterized protein TNCV_562581 [Trichonephila clavipes]
MNSTKRTNDGASTFAARAVEIMQVDDKIGSKLTTDCVGFDCVRSSFLKTHWAAASARLKLRRLSTIHSDISVMCRIISMASVLIEANKEKHLPLLNNTFPD